MEAIFHEKQEGSLCAQHCLNSLLQGAYFTPVDLSTLAHRMDEEERQRMAENGVDSEEYRRFLEQPSGNMDDSGYFSVQVISSALEVWGLELVPYSSTDERIKHALSNPCAMRAFICNYRDHWFTVRRIGNQWFNLNSLLSKPELITDTYLALFLAQLKNDGYSIFVVVGDLPDCDADQLLRLRPAVPTPKVRGQDVGRSGSDPELEAAIKLSLSENQLGQGQLGPNQLGPDQLGRGQLGPVQLGQDPLGLVQLGRDQLGHVPLGRDQLGQVQLGRDQLGRDQLGHIQLGQDQLGHVQLGQEHLRLGGESQNCSFEVDDPDLQQALQLSLQGAIEEEDDDTLLRKAIHMSLEC